ncbi:MAG TPA: AAA family ATPase [Candidatus Saccharimonadales bacterium]|nr:AAA family ATPase [Candidatus Saccharimonadales bacterium]
MPRRPWRGIFRPDPLRQLGRFLEFLRRHPRPAAVVAVAEISATILLGSLALTEPDQTPVAASGPAFTYAQMWTLVELQHHADAGDVVAITTPAVADPNVPYLVARTHDGQTVRVDLSVTPAAAVSALDGFGCGRLMTAEAQATVRAAANVAGQALPSAVGWLIPLLLIGLAIIVMLRVGRGRGGGTETGRRFHAFRPIGRRDRAQAPNASGPATPGSGVMAVRLADVAGCDEAKLELTETIEFLSSPARFHQLGARIPRGIMLYGPPGTGKTMLARAVAAEAAVPFYYASGSDFVEKYVGVGARRIRDLFARARRTGRGVIFFDEFDALGKARGGQNSHEEREQTLNQLLVELDGFSTTDDLVVIAATNRVDTLDPAVLRPGRFNRKIHVGLPDLGGRAEILRVHARNKPLAATVDLEGIARRTYGFSGAELADLLNEAAIMSARRAGSEVSPEDLHAGWLKVAVGTARHRSMDERERSIIAAHEVGHAICGKVHGEKRRVEEISLFAHGEALGVTVSSQEDNDLPSESDLQARLVALMGGRAAEEILFQEVTGGASNDFEKANQIAVTMVTKWGMGRDPEATHAGSSGRGQLSFPVASNGEPLPSEVQPAATRAIRAILDDAYAAACATLVEHMETLRRISSYLVEHERVDGDTFDALFEGTRAVPNPAGEWRAAAARPRAWSDIAAFVGERQRPRLIESLHPLQASIPVLPASASAAAAVIPRPAPGSAPGSAPAAVPGPASYGREPSTSADRAPSPAQPRNRVRLLRALRARRPHPTHAPTNAASVERRLRTVAGICLQRAGARLRAGESHVQRD